MPTIRRTITVDRPLSKVWSFLSDFTTTETWDPGTVSTTRRSGDGGVGTIYDNVSEFAGRRSELVYTVTDVRPEQLFRLRGEHDALVATDTMTFTGDGSTTTVEYEAVFEFQGWLRFVAPLLAPAFKRLGDHAEAGMRQALNAL